MRYVVDAGRSKQKILAEGGTLAQYDVRWISKASAQQRAGRSGRTGPGHCYRCPLACLLDIFLVFIWPNHDLVLSWISLLVYSDTQQKV